MKVLLVLFTGFMMFGCATNTTVKPTKPICAGQFQPKACMK